MNIWPRPFQQPRPPIWVTIGSAASGVLVAERDYIGAVFLAGYMNVRRIFDGYRAAYLKHHGRPAHPNRLAYAALVYVAETEAKAREGAEKNLWYMWAAQSAAGERAALLQEPTSRRSSRSARSCPWLPSLRL